MSSIPMFSSKVSAAELTEALERDGCAVVKDVIDRSVRDALAAELAPYLAGPEIPADLLNQLIREQVPYDNFFSGNTKRAIAMIRKSPTFRTFVTHPLMLGACDGVLMRNCASYHVHATAAFLVGPGATDQVLHREEDSLRFFKPPRP